MNRNLAVILLMIAFVSPAGASMVLDHPLEGFTCPINADDSKDGKKEGDKTDEEAEPDCD